MQRFSFASKIGREGRKRKEEGISYSIKPNNPRPVINTAHKRVDNEAHRLHSVSSGPLERFRAFHTRGIRRCIKLPLALDPLPRNGLGNTQSSTAPPRHRPSRDRNCHRLLLELGWNGKKSMSKIFISSQKIYSNIYPFPFTGFIDRNILT